MPRINSLHIFYSCKYLAEVYRKVALEEHICFVHSWLMTDEQADSSILLQLLTSKEPIEKPTMYISPWKTSSPLQFITLCCLAGAANHRNSILEFEKEYTDIEDDKTRTALALLTEALNIAHYYNVFIGDNMFQKYLFKSHIEHNYIKNKFPGRTIENPGKGFYFIYDEQHKPVFNGILKDLPNEH